MIELWLNNEIVDLSGKETIAIDYAMFSVEDIGKRKSARSYEFKLPDTSRNRRILEVPTELSSNSTLPYSKIEARLLSDGVDIGIKYATISSANNGYTVNLYGGIVSFYDIIKNKKLNELNLDSLNHVWDFTTVTDSRNNTSGYIYPIINYGADETVMGNIERKVQADKMFPALFLDTVLNEIVSQAGYAFENDMLSDTQYIDNPIILPTTDAVGSVKYNAIFNIDNDTPCTTDRTPIIKPINILSINTYDGNYWNLPYNTTYTFQTNVIPASGLYFEDNIDFTLKFTITVENNSGSNKTLQLWLSDGSPFNGHSAFLKSVVVSAGTQTYTIEIDVTNATFPVFGGFQITLNQRTILFFGISDGGSQVIIKAGSTIEVLNADKKERILFNSKVLVSSILPNMKQIDLIRAYCQMFCLLPMLNEETKTFSLVKFNDIEDGISDFIDWSDKIDLTDKPTIKYLPSGYAQQNNMKWAKDGSEIQPEGTNSFVPVNNFNLEKEKDIIELEFASTYSQDMLLNIKVPRIGILKSDTIEDSKEPRMLILYREAINDLQDTSDFIYEHNSDTLTLTGADELPLCRFIEPSFNYNLGFGNSLIGLYYRALNNVLSDYKNVTCKIRLNAADINQLDFFKPVYIKYFNAYFYINNIKGYNPDSAESTEVELIKLF